MSALQVIAGARAAGVVLRLKAPGKVGASGPAPALKDWTEPLRHCRDEVLAVLRLEEAEHALQTFAQTHGIPWPAARAQLTDADLLAGHESLQYAEQTQSAPEFRMVQGWLHSLVTGQPWSGCGR